MSRGVYHIIGRLYTGNYIYIMRGSYIIYIHYSMEYLTDLNYICILMHIQSDTIQTDAF